MKKIMFNDRYGLTQAVLDGRKTMTRRVISKEREDWLRIVDGDNTSDWYRHGATYLLGEVVAVAQSYKEIHETEAISPNEIFNRDYYEQTKGWTNKMFVLANLMYHHIRITDVRVERLQDITDEDCLREGIIENTVPCQFAGIINNYTYEGALGVYVYAREAFSSLINRICGKGTWKSNPWVFVYEFELVK